MNYAFGTAMAVVGFLILVLLRTQSDLGYWRTEYEDQFIMHEQCLFVYEESRKEFDILNEMAGALRDQNEVLLRTLEADATLGKELL